MDELDSPTRRILAELLMLLSGDSDPGALKAIIASKLEQLNQRCLTAGCDHGLMNASVCDAYSTSGMLLGVEGAVLESKTQDLNPLVQTFFCDIFPHMEDAAKTRCKSCEESQFASRRDFEGLFCHGCGLFIDFKNRQIGYVNEWTTRYKVGSKLGTEPLKCRNCGSPVVTAKFGDYGFCSKDCLEQWYLDQVRTKPQLMQ